MEESQEISAEKLHATITPQKFAAPSDVSELLEKYCKADDDIIIINEMLIHIGRHLPQSPQRDQDNEIMINALQLYFEAAVDKIRFHGKQVESATIRDQYGNIIETMMQLFSGSFSYTYRDPQFNHRYRPKARVYQFSLNADGGLSVRWVDESSEK